MVSNRSLYITNDISRLHLSHLIPLVGNNGCGPESVEDLCEQIKEAIAKANAERSAQVMSFAGAYDILVNPSGSFSLLPTNLMTYEFDDEDVIKRRRGTVFKKGDIISFCEQKFKVIENYGDSGLVQKYPDGIKIDNFGWSFQGANRTELVLGVPKSQ